MTTDPEITKILNKPTRAYEKFHMLTGLQSKQGKEIPLDSWPEEWKTIFHKAYVRFNSIPLPRKKLPGISLEKALEERISERVFSDKKLTLDDLGSLFFYAAGIKKKGIQRYYPSAGARFPLELYFISTNSELPNGIYHYYAPSHCLEQLITFETFHNDNYMNQPWIKKAGGIIVVSAMFRRTTNKYGNRGYRYVVCESGHLGQNLHLVATSLKLSLCSIGGFEEKNLNTLLDIDGLEESSLYCFAIGKKCNKLIVD